MVLLLLFLLLDSIMSKECQLQRCKFGDDAFIFRSSVIDLISF